jgi:hypothetical protein
MMKNQLSDLFVGPRGLQRQTKDFSFSTTDRANLAYLEACEIIEQFTPFEGPYFVKQIGNTVRIPTWVPYIPSN